MGRSKDRERVSKGHERREGPVTVQLALGNGSNGDMSDVGHARESLSTKAHRLDGLQVLKRRQLGRRVPLAQYRQVLKLSTA